MMVSEKEFNDIDLSVKQNNLYLEESFTDLDMTSIRRLTPVKSNGLKDKSHKQIFVGHLNLMTSEGPLPIQTPLAARNLKEAMETYPEAMKTALEKMQEEIKSFNVIRNYFYGFSGEIGKLFLDHLEDWDKISSLLFKGFKF
jgi:hypothetical protein